MSFRTKGSSATTRGLKATTRSGGGGHNWSEFTVDEENGIAFVGFGSPRYDFYGGDRKGNNLFANSLVAIDARTGKRHLASAAHSPRPLGLGHSAVGQAADDPPERQAAAGRRAGHEAGVPLRLRSQDRPADLADRGAAGAADRRARRVVVAHAAVPDEAGAVRQAVVHRKGHQPVPAEGGAGRAARAAADLSQRRAVHAAEFRRLGGDAGTQRRRQLRHQRGRSRPWRVLRRPQVAADDDPASRCRRRLAGAGPGGAAAVAGVAGAAAATRSSRPSRRRS